MDRVLSEDSSRAIARDRATVVVTINPQSEMGDADCTMPEITLNLTALHRLLYAKAEEIADAIERATSELEDECSGATTTKHYASRTVSADNSGFGAFASIKITSPCRVSRSLLMSLARDFLDSFEDYVSEQVMDAEHGVGQYELVFLNLRDLLLDPNSTLADLIGTGEPCLGDRV